MVIAVDGAAAPGDETPGAEPAAPEPPAYQPQWDPARQAYLQWNPKTETWLQFDDGAQEWRPIERAAEPEVAPPDPGGPLGDKVRRGLRWSGLNLVVAKLVSFSSGIILARVLVPDDFGAYAAALAIVNVLFGLNDLGVLLAVVRAPRNLEVVRRTGMTLAASSSLFLYGVVFVSAPAFASWVNSPEAAALLRVLALTIVIDGLTTVSQGLLVRAFDQRAMAIAEFASTPVNFALAITLALAGAGAWSLVIAQVVANCLSGLLLVTFASWRPRFGFDRAEARTILAFGLPLAATSVVEYTLLNADYVIIGQSLGAVAIGLYVLAYNVSNWPTAVLTDAVRRVSIAGFARLADDVAVLRARFTPALATLLTVSVPVCLGLGVLAGPLIRLVYGTKWSASVEVLTFLAILGGVRVTIGFIFDLLVGAGRTRTTLVLQLVWLAVLVPALIVGVEADGIRGVAIAHAIVGGSVALPAFLWSLHRFGVDLNGLGSLLVRPAIGGVAACVAGVFVDAEIDSDLWSLLLAGPVVLLVYCAIVLPGSTLLRRPGGVAVEVAA